MRVKGLNLKGRRLGEDSFNLVLEFTTAASGIVDKHGGKLARRVCLRPAALQ